MLYVELVNPTKTNKLMGVQLYNYTFVKVNKNYYTPFFMIPEFVMQITEHITNTKNKRSRTLLIKKISKMWENYKKSKPLFKKNVWVVEKIPAFTKTHEKLFIDTVNGMLGIGMPLTYPSVYEYSKKYITPLHMIEFFSGVKGFSKSYSTILYVFDEDNNFTIFPMINTAFPSIAPGPIMVLKKEKFMNMLLREIRKRKNTAMIISLPLSDPFYIISYTVFENTQTLSIATCDGEYYSSLISGNSPYMIETPDSTMIVIPFNNEYSVLVSEQYNSVYITPTKNSSSIIDRTVKSLKFTDNKFIIKSRKNECTHYVQPYNKFYSDNFVTMKTRNCVETLLNRK